MSTHVDNEGLRLALDEAAATGDADLDDAVARAVADLERIQRGLQLVAEELPAPVVSRTAARRRWSFLGVAVGAAAVVVAFTVLALTHRRAGPASPVAAAPRMLPDRFDYSPGSVGSSASPPGLLYSVPSLWAISSAPTADAAWIVGGDFRHHGLAWRWNGSSWRNVGLPPVGGDVELHAVATLNASDAWAVGTHSGPSDQFQVTRALIEHWDGARWAVAPIPHLGPAYLWAVSATTADDVWAAGATYHRGPGGFSTRYLQPLLLHWNGRAWRTVTVPWARGGLEVDKIVATARNSVWAVSSGGRDVRTILVEHWDGHHWRVIPAPFGTADPIRGFTATAGDDAWAVGGYRRAGHSHTLAAHWNGHTWQIAPTRDRATDSALTGVVSVTANDVWAIGQSQTIKIIKNDSKCSAPCIESTGTFPVALFEHWDGRRWRIMRGATPQIWEGEPMLTASRGGAAWAAGSCYFDNVLTRWNGNRWEIARHPPDQYWNPTTPRRLRHHLTSCS